jgi:mono/diheme cytochrome c family protein
MRAPVRVLEQPAFQAWLAKQRSAGGASGGAQSGGAAGGAGGQAGGAAGGQAGGGSETSALGKETFASAGCGGCHTFAPAGTDAQVGPDLDNLAADAQAAGEPVADYVRQSIVDPNAVIAKGYQPGVMPETFGDTLKPDELDALVAYLSGEGDS